MASSQQIEDIIKILNGDDERRVPNRKRHDIYTNYFYLSASDLVERV
jgi:hypothetical protein